MHKRHANRYHGQFSLHTLAWGYGTDNVALYKWDNKGFDQDLDMDETGEIAKETALGYERRDPVGSRAHSLGLGMDI